MNGLIVFLPGNVIGPFGTKIRASYALNAPFVLIPILYLVRVLSQPRQVQEQRNSKWIKTFTDPILILLLNGAIVLTFVRLFAAMGSPTAIAREWLKYEPLLRDPLYYPRLQILVHFFYFVPWFCIAQYQIFSGKWNHGRLT
jgi:hypothetical protein